MISAFLPPLLYAYCAYKNIYFQLCNELDADNISRTFKATKQHDMAATKFEGK